MFIFDSTFTINRSSGTKWTIPNSDVIWHLPVKGDTKTETAKVLQRAVLGCFCLWGLSAWNGLMGTHGKKRNSFSIHPFGLACFIAAWERLPYPDADICVYIYIYNIFVTTSFRGRLFVCFCKIFDCLMSLGLIDCLNHSWWVDSRSAHGIDIKNVALAVSSTKAAVTSRTFYFCNLLSLHLQSGNLSKNQNASNYWCWHPFLATFF